MSYDKAIDTERELTETNHQNQETAEKKVSD